MMTIKKTIPCGAWTHYGHQPGGRHLHQLGVVVEIGAQGGPGAGQAGVGGGRPW